MEFDRRRFIGAGSCAVAGLTAQRSFAHDAPAHGMWTALTDMPFAVQEIYPCAFWKGTPPERGLKSGPFDIIVNAGGITADAAAVTDRVTYYDLPTDKWHEGTPLPAPRHHIALAVNSGSLFAIGGFARNEDMRWQMRTTCWRTDNVNGVWEPTRPLPYPQAETVCVTNGGYIHAIGGRSPSGSRNADWIDHLDTDKHWIYDVRADRWLDGAPLLNARNSAAGAVIGGLIYVVGGRNVNDTNKAELNVYDPNTNRWSTARPMPKAQGGLAAAAHNGKLYAFGGEFFDGTGGVYKEAWEYDPDTDRWRAVADMTRPRHGLGAVAMNDGIYVLGGAAKPGGVETSAALDKFTI